jgi:hypothetical protein
MMIEVAIRRIFIVRSGVTGSWFPLYNGAIFSASFQVSLIRGVAPPVRRAFAQLSTAATLSRGRWKLKGLKWHSGNNFLITQID